MSSFGRYNSQSQSYAPSAPALPEEHPYGTTTSSTPSNYNHGSGYTTTSTSGHGPSSYNHGSGYGQGSSYGYPTFPPGTDPDLIRSFQIVDKDRSGFIDENELQQALSSGFHWFSLRTIGLLTFLFKNPNDPSRIGPKEFGAIWSCLGRWREIFERYDRDKSGKIDPMELRDALYGTGYAVPASVLQLLISKHDDGSGRRVELGFDSFVECGMIVKGLTDKFKEKDRHSTGSATLSYDTFMTMVLPFLLTYD
ncbi:putative Ef-hand calcium binding protein [Quillaja saponaria]|uniref:Ef-hand calcium binding protein n=1 Tax=Quillaja saponaria TaxID=32244 RepID=A0AAD7PAD6_QUISA|nr:putative Ef-hand calcium binding protein [Quillaja saponaria]